MVTGLLRTHEKWVDCKKFNGPSVFIVLFYADRVVQSKRTIARVFSLLKGWRTNALCEIERVGVGRGFVEDRYNSALQRRGSSIPAVQDKSKLCWGREEGRSGSYDSEQPEAYTLQLLRTS